MQSNYYWLHYTMKQLHPSLHFELVHLERVGETSRTIVLNAQNRGLSALKLDSIKLQLNMTLFKSVEVSLEGKPIELKCLSYHCKFDLKDIPAETNQTLKIKMELESNVTHEAFEEIIVEYWPNDQLDPIGESPHVSKLEVKLDQFDTDEGVWTGDMTDVEPEKPKNSKRTSILVVFFIFLLLIGICLLASKKIKEKCR